MQFVAALLVALSFLLNPIAAQAQLPAPGKNMLTKEELRACMILQRKNETDALQIKSDQTAFLRDHSALKAEQAEIAKSTENLNAQSAQLATERRAIEEKMDALKVALEAAKTDEQRAAYEVERKAAVERANAFEITRGKLNAGNEAHNERAKAFNAKSVEINARNKTVNERVAPHQASVADWTEACQNRRFFNDEEAEIKKELKM